MHPNTRAGIAYIVSALANEVAGTGVFDYAQCKSFSFSGTVQRDYVSILDHERRCHITGRCDSLYDQGRKTQLSLSLSNNHFTGYDVGDAQQFCGDVNGNTVMLHEKGSTSRFTFRIF
ncbi:MAG: hypothetical protein KGL17_02825 [Betaproteobacteria bacterium]|nr:hypothetical protein [Betaproteobacteria bacterium]MDE2353934.1 hypothetical protein [Betaproteobacteria bacterium]